jgi:hypothetical protein
MLVTPFQKQHYIVRKISDQLSPLTRILVDTDYFLKAEILSIEKEDYYPTIATDKKGPPLPKVNITFRIIDCLKGDKRCSIGSTWTFFYMAIYRPANLFSEGDVCLLPLQIGHNYEATLTLNYLINLHTEPSEGMGYLPIIDGQLIDKDNYFGFGEKIEWEKFRSQILETVNEIKSW